MAQRARRYWLMKSEPDVFGIEDLRKKGRTAWDGVRNYRARNFMRDEMAVGDLVLFYHSSASPPGVAGVARVASESYPDPTQFDARSQYRDPKATPDQPRWWLVDVEFVECLPEPVSLAQLKEDPRLDGMWVTKRGMRLSVQPVDRTHFRRVLRLGRATTES
jgi:predicted RNA-binding protein with PUA-like domain